MIIILSGISFAQEIPLKDDIVEKETIIEEVKSDAQKELREDLKKESKKSNQSMADILNLSRDQISELRKHRETFKAEKSKLKNEIVEMKKELNDELLKTEPDEQKVKELTEEISKISDVQQEVANESTRELTKILDEDQLSKLKEINRDEFSKTGKKGGRKKFKEDVTKEAADIQKEIKNEYKKEMKDEYKKGTKDEYKKEMKNEYQKDVKDEYKKEMKDDYEKDKKEYDKGKKEKDKKYNDKGKK